ncbi:flagellar biosynthetic protein FliO [Brucella rhizosphaerae]|uniref:Flagellar biosynthesis, FliO family protein n=1 Tax=Brucella rhizosphaerae TaxID=571254 RepID=A0A256FI00_9HYPH|nr:flagellar biosynthetic protein FliO [Brucella rhizosphaerae]OYR14463.1 flagellar biosynthesis, FliO family protein [Brucella rhizosphaerae]
MKEWLSGLVGESTANIVGFILIFAIILGGIFVVLSIIRRFSGGGFATNGRTGRQPRLSVMDAAAVDSRRKLVLIRRDDVEHLLLIGGPTDVVVEQNIVMESRANSRSQTVRIEPEHIERFRQHEANISSEVAERPALTQHASQSVEKGEAIQLNSPIETPVQRRPEPVRETPVQQVSPEAPQFRAPPRPPVSPVAPQPPKTTEAPVVQARPQPPRPAPNYPPQPRTVLPAARPTEQPQSPRLHPAYPLSQVSRGVLSSTSGLGAAAAAVAASDLGGVTPEREVTTSAKATVSEIGDILQSPTVTTSSAPDFTPVAPKTEPVTASSNSEPEAADDDLGDLGGALHDAIMADLETDSLTGSENKEPEMLEVDIFEEELLGSLDISPNGGKPDDSIEDEMEKLLGELTKNETRNF